MQTSEHDITILEALQNVDREGMLAQRDLDALPQRDEIIAVREQKAQVLSKKVQVQDMLDAAEDEFMKFFQEDEKLEARQKESESGLHEAEGDFRRVEARSKELNGIVKRRRVLSDELERCEKEINKIKPVLDQILQALIVLDKKEAALIESYQQEGGALRRVIAESESHHASLSSDLDPALYSAYEVAQARCGGVALAHLQGNTCDCCRTSFDQGKLSTLLAEAPIATCPHCRRLLVIADE